MRFIGSRKRETLARNEPAKTYCRERNTWHGLKKSSKPVLINFLFMDCIFLTATSSLNCGYSSTGKKRNHRSSIPNGSKTKNLPKSSFLPAKYLMFGTAVPKPRQRFISLVKWTFHIARHAMKHWHTRNELPKLWDTWCERVVRRSLMCGAPRTMNDLPSLTTTPTVA